MVDCNATAVRFAGDRRFKAQTTQGGARSLGLFESALDAAICYARNLLEQKSGATEEGVEVVVEEEEEGEEEEGEEEEGEEEEGEEVEGEEGEEAEGEEEGEAEGEEEELTAKESEVAAKVEDLTLLRSDNASGFVNVERRALTLVLTLTLTPNP